MIAYGQHLLIKRVSTECVFILSDTITETAATIRVPLVVLEEMSSSSITTMIDQIIEHLVLLANSARIATLREIMG